jgi:hypothetical protein
MEIKKSIIIPLCDFARKRTIYPENGGSKNKLWNANKAGKNKKFLYILLKI